MRQRGRSPCYWLSDTGYGWLNARSPITDRGEIVGAALISREEARRPIYVSIGHKVSLERAIEIVEHCTQSGRLPEPIRIAHMLATQEMKKHKQEITHES